ncbi:hypothetical protein CEXT_396681 [Caerostris extrusa]|uniref:Uncharacterized protein n=1 Tax=Caerostris extrusa TaxID=172846 RepID=A0AAV4N5V6_CAEEX|nr:hypothetical protein CEXT_396681 [Caerostris extrusa]
MKGEILIPQNASRFAEAEQGPFVPSGINCIFCNFISRGSHSSLQTLMVLYTVAWKRGLLGRVVNNDRVPPPRTVIVLPLPCPYRQDMLIGLDWFGRILLGPFADPILRLVPDSRF